MESLSVEGTLLELLTTDVGVESILCSMRRKVGLGTVQVDEVMGWPAGRCEAVEAGRVRLTEVDELRRLMERLGGRDVVDRVVVEMAVERVKRWLDELRFPHEALVAYACHVAVRDQKVEVLYAATLEYAARLGVRASALREGLGDVDADPGDFMGGGASS